MGRTKGSKNRDTILKDLRRRGVTGDLEGLDHPTLVKMYETAQVEKPVPTEPVERTVVDPDVAQAIVSRTRKEFDRLTSYHAPGVEDDGVGEDALVPERIQEYLRRAFFAPTPQEAEEVGRRAVDKLYVHLLNLTAKGRIPGPNTPENIQKRARAAESWAKKLEKDGKAEAAQKQREKVAAILATPVVNTAGWAVGV